MTNLDQPQPNSSAQKEPHRSKLNRRDFLKAAGIVAGSALLAACAPPKYKKEYKT